MSKREIRAKRLVAAVLLAISVQMWSAPPLWAAEASVQTETSAAGEAKETKETKNAKATDSETGGEADADEGETVVVPVSATVRARPQAATTASCRWLMPQTLILILAASWPGILMTTVRHNGRLMVKVN